MENNISPIFPLKSGSKIPKMSWQKDKEKRPAIETHESYDDLGYVPTEGQIVIDTDCEESTKGVIKLLDMMDMKVFSYATDKGRHFVFKLPKGSVYSHLGSKKASIFPEVDAKGNGKGFVKIKGNGKYRIDPLVLQSEFEKAPYLPAVLAVDGKLKINIDDYVKNGRDIQMFAWLAKMRAAKWDKKNFVQFAACVAMYAGDTESFDDTVAWASAKWDSSVAMGEPVNYLPEDLTEKQYEIASCLTQNKTKTYNGIKNFDRLYELIIDRYELSYNVDDKQVWGHHRDRVQPILKLEGLISKFFISSKIKNIDPMIIAKIEKGIIPHLPEKKINPRVFTMSFRNKVWDGYHNTEESAQDSTKYIVSNQIPHRLIDKEALTTTHKDAAGFLKTMMNNWTKNRPEIEQELYEMIGVSMSKYMDEDKAYFLLGNAENGKSWFLDFLMVILGRFNVSTEDLKMLSNNDFSSSTLYGKLANINADISATVINDPSTFKKFTSGDYLSAQFKGKDMFSFKPYATPIFGANNIPYTKELGDSDAIDRRLKLIPFDNKFKKASAKEKTDLKNRLLSEEVVEVAIYKAVQALNQGIEKGFTESKASKAKLKQHLKETNHVISFVEATPLKPTMDAQNVYEKYKVWANSKGYTPLGFMQFDKKFSKVARMMNIQIFRTSYGDVELYNTIREEE